MPPPSNQPISIFSLTLTPALVGTSLAWAESGRFDWQMALLILSITLLVQLGYGRARLGITLRPPGNIFGEEMVIFLIFGPAALLGGYYLQNNMISLNSLFAACAIGLQAAAIGVASNSRYPRQGIDVSPFSILPYLGQQRAQSLYSGLLLLPFLLLLPIFFFRPVAGIALITLSPTIRMIRFYCDAPRGPEFDRILTGTASLQLISGLALSIGLLFG
jgi:1,4-dihydroxy-2-naphthoate octaprenyltransferase